ncbi:MAG: hypothetical protein U5Q44_05170 [Dehalococcoidia bacterium]|nr:hypothetical protein [Dehalococcoidia bacterium]
MGVLQELGFATDDQRGLLIDPPDHVLAEAASLKPRPSVVSNLQTAEPATRIAWWPDEGRLAPGYVSRLHWMVSLAHGEAWAVYDPGDEDSVDRGVLDEALEASQFTVGEARQLSTGEIALPLAAKGHPGSG